MNFVPADVVGAYLHGATKNVYSAQGHVTLPSNLFFISILGSFDFILGSFDFAVAELYQS